MGKDGANAVKARANVNAIPQIVIEISPDTERKFKSRSVEGRNKGKGSSRRKVQTLTSILTHDIDAADVEDQMSVVDYVDDIYKFYKLAEVCFHQFYTDKRDNNREAIMFHTQQ